MEFFEELLHKGYDPRFASAAEELLQDKTRMFGKSGIVSRAVNCTEILNDKMLEAIHYELPSDLRDATLLLMYSSTRDGYSATTLINHLQMKRFYVLNETLLLIKVIQTFRLSSKRTTKEL